MDTTNPIDLRSLPPYEAVRAVEATVQEALRSAGIDHKLVELVKIRISQINGCAHCLRMHTADSLASGEDPVRLAVLPAWHESAYFTAAERAALELAEAITNISTSAVPVEIQQRAKDELGDGAAAIAWLAIQMNVWNRIAVTNHYYVGP